MVRSALRSANVQRRLQTSSKDAGKRYSVNAFIRHSTIAQQTQQIQLSQAAFSALILTGETETGKGLAAKIIHYNSTRAKDSL